MSKCDLTVVLQREDRTYHPGDEVVGAVKIAVNKSCTCDRIYLTVFWRTHGKGNRDAGEKLEVIIAEGQELAPGHDHMLPFRFVIPVGPVTIRGNYINVDWYVKVQVDIPWAIDPKAEEEFIVVRDPNNSALPLKMGNVEPEVFTSEKFAQKQGAQRVLGAGCGGILVVGAAIFIAVVIMKGGSFIPLIFAGVISFIGLGLLIKSGANILAAKKLGEVKVELEPTEFRAGEQAQVQLQFRPTRDVDIADVSAVLKCEESATSGSGTNQTTYRNTLFEEQVMPTGPIGPFLGGPALVVFNVTVPADGLPTFTSGDNKIRWTIALHIDVKKWPDWKAAIPLVIKP